MKDRLKTPDNLTREWIIDRLEDAVQTHDIVPDRIGTSQGIKNIYNSFEILPDEHYPDEDSPFSKLVATAVDIRRMDEVMDWIRHLGGAPKQRRVKVQVIWLRSHTQGGRNRSWRKVGKKVGTSHTQAQIIYDSTITELFKIVSAVRNGELDLRSKPKIVTNTQQKENY